MNINALSCKDHRVLIQSQHVLQLVISPIVPKAMNVDLLDSNFL